MIPTDEEKSILEQIYGRQVLNGTRYNAHQIVEILDLTSEEQKFFSRKNFVSPNFSVQTLYKLAGKLIPLKFNRAVHSLMVEAKNFRANFCNVGNKTVKVVFDENKPIPEIVYRNLTRYEGEDLDDMLTKIMEADRRLDFDLQKGDLIRLSVFHTNEDEFAILITMPQIIAGSFNAKNFFNTVFSSSDYKILDSKTFSLQVSAIEDSVRNYWQKILKDLPPFKGVPYSKAPSGNYNGKAYREKIPADIVSDMRIKAQSNKTMLMAILQTAWGFLLQTLNKVDETAFCRLILNSKNIDSENALSLNVIPIRLKSSGSETVEAIVNNQFKQMIISQSYSFFDWQNLQSMTAGRGVNFDHFLSFLNFQADQKNYSESTAEPFGKLVAKNFWDNCGMKLAVYFQYSNTDLSVTFFYDANRFPPAVGMKFSKIYDLILQNMLDYWQLPFEKFINRVTEIVFMDPQIVEEAQARDDRKIIMDFISSNKILQGDNVGADHIFADSAKLITYFEGDRIHGETLENNLVFVVEGKIARNLDTGDGWYNTLDIISKGGWINANILLKKSERRTNIAGEVLTEQATILLIPIANAANVLRKYPGYHKNFMKHILTQMEKYQVLWLQS
ncbi:MAG: hypothetical protein IK062_08530 [Selenomonadaceae bacterium]|nr:hypothetical protein [Selenomonadaceae bacterium]